MKTKMLLATLALIVVPTLALAGEACGFGHTKTEQIVMSCAEGSIYDIEEQRCVPTTG